ncbi:MAG: hydrogenase maturation nickel metallochaperone HypA [Thermodesulfovibrionales bacterium]
MHEASIALSILGIAENNCREAGYERVESIRVRVGRASGVLPDALVMAFDIVKAGTVSENASLLVDDVPVGGRCRACGQEFTTEDLYILACPLCGSGDFTVDSGRELDITEIEVH